MRHLCIADFGDSGAFTIPWIFEYLTLEVFFRVKFGVSILYISLLIYFLIIAAILCLGMSILPASMGTRG